MSPYIITTKRLHAVTAASGCDDYIAVSRRAVATLEEAQQVVVDYCRSAKHRRLWGSPEWRTAELFDSHVAESGGTVGPLPDGTVIEVEPTTEFDLKIKAVASPRCSLTEAIDAFNARQS